MQIKHIFVVVVFAKWQIVITNLKIEIDFFAYTYSLRTTPICDYTCVYLRLTSNWPNTLKNYSINFC